MRVLVIRVVVDQFQSARNLSMSLKTRSRGLPAGLPDRAFYARVAQDLFTKARFNGLWLELLKHPISKHAEAR